MKTKVTKTLAGIVALLAVAAALLASTSATCHAATWEGADDFSSGISTTNWTIMQMSQGQMTVVGTNGHASFLVPNSTTAEQNAYIAWKGTPSAAEDWTVDILGHNSASYSTGGGSALQLAVLDTASLGSVLQGFVVTRENSPSYGSIFGTTQWSGGSYAGRASVSSTVTNFGLRLAYHAASRQIEAWYDPTATGSSWTKLDTINLSDFSPSMTATDTFTIAILSDTYYGPISEGDIWADDFQLTSEQSGWRWSQRVASASFWPEEPNVGLALDASDNCYVTGWFDGTNDFGGVTLTNQSAGGSDIFVAKYNASGALQWAQRAGGTSNNYGRGVGTDTNGNLYVAGTYQGPANFNGINLPATSGEEFFLAKYNSVGAVQWVHSSTGGSDQNIGIGLTVDSAGNSYALAVMDHSGTSLTFGSKTVTTANYGHTLLILVKYDNTGTAQWAQLFDSSQETYGSKVAVDAAGNVYVRGTFDSDMEIGTSNLVGNAGNNNIFVAKFNSSGALVWVQQPEGDTSAGEGGVAVDPAGNVYVSGAFTTNLNFGGGIILTNTANAGALFGDAFLAKYSSSGAIQWAQPAGDTDGGFYWDVALDAQTNIYAAGFLGYNAAISKCSRDGMLQWTHSAGGQPASPVASGVAKCAVDSVGNCYLAGFYQGTAIFGANALQPQGAWNVFLAEIGAYSFGAEIQSTLSANITYDSTNGLLQYTDTANPSEDYAGLPLIGSAAALITDTNNWTASLTVNLPARTMTATSTEEPFAGMGLFVLINGSVNNIIELALEQRNDTGVPNYNLYGNGVPFTALANSQGVQTTPLDGSQLQHNGTSLLQLSSGTATGPATETNDAVSGVLMLSFSAATDILTGYYNGTPVGSISLTNWGANPPLTLVVAGLSGEGVAVSAGTDTGSNFSVGASPPQHPTIQFTADPTNGAEPLSVQFNSPNVDNLGNFITSWNWNFGDGGTSIMQSPSHTYTTVGTFAPTLVATNSQGEAIIATGPQITSITAPTLQFSASPTNGEPPLQVQFDSPAIDSSGHSVISWNWNFGDGGTDISQNPSHTYTHTGVFTPILVATNASGLAVVGDGPQITVFLPFAFITNNGAITIRGYTGAGGTLIIPITINGYPVTSIGDNAFLGATNLSSVTIPGSVTNIGSQAFENCSNLTSVTISNGVVGIGSNAFFETRLTDVFLPASVAGLGESAFGDCRNLTVITVDSNNPSYSSLNGVLFDKHQTTLLQFPSGRYGDYIVPNSVTNIGDGALAFCLLNDAFYSGDAPSVGSNAFLSDNLINYYLPCANGWGSTLGGMPAKEQDWVSFIPSFGQVYGMDNTFYISLPTTDQCGHSITNWPIAYSYVGDTNGVFRAVGMNNGFAFFTTVSGFITVFWPPVVTNDIGQSVVTFGGPYFSPYTWRITAPNIPDLTLNGDFESGDFTSWTLAGDTARTFVKNESQSAVLPPSGSFVAILATSGGTGSISQTLATAPGKGYLLSFWLRNFYQDPGEFTVSGNGNTIYDDVNFVADEWTNWTNIQLPLVATGTNTSLQFSFQDDNHDFGLDDVSVVAYPTTPAPTVLSAPQVAASNANFAFQLLGPAGTNYVLQASTNLVDWNSVSTSSIPISGSITLTNAISGYNRRFYRVHLQ